MSIPDETENTPAPERHGILGALEQLAASFLARNDVPPPPPPPVSIPVVEHGLYTPPYAPMAEDVSGRRQSELQLATLSSATSLGATFVFRTRPDFFVIYAIPLGAFATGEGVWVAISQTPPVVPVSDPDPTPSPYFLLPNGRIHVAGSEQYISVTLATASANAMRVFVQAATNVRPFVP